MLSFLHREAMVFIILQVEGLGVSQATDDNYDQLAPSQRSVGVIRRGLVITNSERVYPDQWTAVIHMHVTAP